jgi:hypothetical protein
MAEIAAFYAFHKHAEGPHRLPFPCTGLKNACLVSQPLASASGYTVYKKQVSFWLENARLPSARVLL